MCRCDGRPVSQATVLRCLRTGLLPPAARLRSPPSPPARIGCSVWTSVVRDHRWRDVAYRGLPGLLEQYEHPWHVSPTANQHERDHRDRARFWPTTSSRTTTRWPKRAPPSRPWSRARGDDRDLQRRPVPVVPLRGVRHRTPRTAPRRYPSQVAGQNGSRERGFGSLKYERLFLEEIDDVLAVVKHADAYRVEHNTVRPHEAIAWNRPIQIHPGLVGLGSPTFPETENLPTT